MGEYTYRCRSAKAVADRIWRADFYLDSFIELVDSKDPDSVVATVGLSEMSMASRKLSMVVTLLNHPWSQEIADIMTEDIRYSEPTLTEWTIG